MNALEEAWQKHRVMAYRLRNKDDFRAGFLAGQAAERKRCAEKVAALHWEIGDRGECLIDRDDAIKAIEGDGE